MNDLIKSSLAQIPRYFMDLCDVAARPKTFLGRQDVDSDAGLNRAFVFYGITLLVSALIQIPMLPKAQSASEYMASTFLISMATLAMLALMSLLALRAAWFVVGGKASIRQLFIYMAFLSGPISYLFLLFLITGDVLFRLLDPATAALVRSDPMYRPDDGGMLITEVFALLGFAAVAIWSIYTWGAFRALNQVTKARSLLAFILACVFTTPLLVLSMVLVIYLSPDLLPR